MQKCIYAICINRLTWGNICIIIISCKYVERKLRGCTCVAFIERNSNFNGKVCCNFFILRLQFGKVGEEGGGRGIVFEQGSGYGGDEDASLKMLDSLPTRNLQIFLQSFRLSVYL